MAKKKEITPDMLERIEELSKIGLNQEDMANDLGMSASTFYERMKENPQISERIKRGRIGTTKLIANKLIEKAVNGDTTCMIFYLKCIGKWNDKPGEQNANLPSKLSFTRMAKRDSDDGDE
jgi:hypothetical protein